MRHRVRIANNISIAFAIAGMLTGLALWVGLGPPRYTLWLMIALLSIATLGGMATLFATGGHSLASERTS